jgi:Ca2+-binding RTX toxin-like protein
VRQYLYNLSGSAGNDTLVGGTGNDTYLVDSAGDVITEGTSAGTDTVQAGVTFTLASLTNVENLTLTGTGSINGTGNTARNTNVGNDSNNVLNPGTSGTDVLRGGLGNDTYVVGRTTGITITENANEGTDLVQASVTHTLASYIEMLFLSGSSAINGTGNTLANLLRGNSGVNTLAGAAGNDILEGANGNDTLSDTGGNGLFNGGAGTDTLTGNTGRELFIGGTGNDVITTNTGADLIVFNLGDGQDSVAASTTRDNVLSLGGGALYADLLFQKSGNDLILKIGAADQITFTGYYTSTANRSVDRLQMVMEGTSDYLPGGGDVTYRYNRFGTLSDISLTPAQSILGNAGFVTGSQALQSTGSLQDSTPRLG